KRAHNIGDYVSITAIEKTKSPVTIDDTKAAKKRDDKRTVEHSHENFDDVSDVTATESSKIYLTKSTSKEPDDDDHTMTNPDTKDKDREKGEEMGTDNTSKSKRDLFDEEDVKRILRFKEVKSFGREYSFSTKSSRLMIKLENTPQTSTTKEMLKSMLGEKYDFDFAEYIDPNIKLSEFGWSTGFVSDFSEVMPPCRAKC
ncbi:unnamed protein product, partial [Owenia fusiformis]